MITISSTHFKSKNDSQTYKNFNQEDYNATVKSLKVQECICPNCHQMGLMIRNGWYSRNVIELESSILAKIQRLLCKYCLATHACLPETLIPYYQYSKNVIIHILSNLFKEIDVTYNIDDSLYNRIHYNKALKLLLSPPT